MPGHSTEQVGRPFDDELAAQETISRPAVESHPRVIESLHERILEYQEFLLEADEVWLLLGCGDGRVNAPYKYILHKGRNVALLYITTNGGGLPGKGKLELILSTLDSLSIHQDKIKIIATQHSSHSEYQAHNEAVDRSENQARLQQELDRPFHSASECTCGLRHFFSDHQAVMDFLRNAGSSWLQAAGTQARPTELLNLDEVELKQIIDSAVKTDDVAKEIANLTAGGFSPRFLFNAAFRNDSSDFSQNSAYVTAGLSEYDLGVEILAGHYDHSSQNLVVTVKVAHSELLVERDANVVEERIVHSLFAVNHQENPHTLQNPPVIVVRVGPKASILPPWVVDPHGVNPKVIDNTFDSATTGGEHSILNAFAEAFYPAKNYCVAQDCEDDERQSKSFREVNEIWFICDDDQYMEEVRKAMRSNEFARWYAPVFSRVNGGKVRLFNLDRAKESVQEISSN